MRPVNGQFQSNPVTTRSLPYSLEQLLNRVHFIAQGHPTLIHTVMSKQITVTKYQERVYAALQQIPEGRITTYGAMSKALNSSPRAVGGALRVNPFAPEIPCHRCIASTGVSFVWLGRAMVLTTVVCWWIQRRLGKGAQRAKSRLEIKAATGRRSLVRRKWFSNRQKTIMG